MNYKEKIKHAELVAEDILNNKSLETIREELSEKNLYNRDIDAIIFSAHNIIGEKLKPIIRAKLLAGESIENVPDFEKISPDTLANLEREEIKAIALGERRKVKEMLKQKATPDEIFTAIRQDFYPKRNIEYQISTHKEVKKQNSGGRRMIRILVGLGVAGLGVIISYVSMQSHGGGRLYIGLIIGGLVLMASGFMTIDEPR